MATDKKNRVVYWDTCVFLSLIGDEERKDSGAVHSVREEVRTGTCTIITVDKDRRYKRCDAEA